MAYSLSKRQEAPGSWSRVTSRGVPAWAILAGTAAGFLAVLGNYLLPNKIFAYLLATSGAIALLVYLVIAISQLRMRRQVDESERVLKMWAYPVLSWVVIVFIVGTIAYLAQRDGYKLNLRLTLLLTAVIVVVGVIRQQRAPDRIHTGA